MGEFMTDLFPHSVQRKNLIDTFLSEGFALHVQNQVDSEVDNELLQGQLVFLDEGGKIFLGYHEHIDNFGHLLPRIDMNISSYRPFLNRFLEQLGNSSPHFPSINNQHIISTSIFDFKKIAVFLFVEGQIETILQFFIVAYIKKSSVTFFVVNYSKQVPKINKSLQRYVVAFELQQRYLGSRFEQFCH